MYGSYSKSKSIFLYLRRIVAIHFHKQRERLDLEQHEILAAVRNTWFFLELQKKKIW